MIQILYGHEAVCGKNDCYVPPDSTHPSDEQFFLSPFQLHALRPHALLQTMPIDDTHAVAFVPSLSKIVVLNDEAINLINRLPVVNGFTDTNTQDAMLKLYHLGVLTLDNVRTISQPTCRCETLAAWIHITNACNMHCDYCYLVKGDRGITESTAHAAVDAVIRSANANGFQKIALKYGGGEPTLMMQRLASLHAYALEQTARYGLQLSASLFTNGTKLSYEVLTGIQQLNIELVISLDTTVPSRRYPDAAVVLQNIERALDLQLNPTISVTITPHTLDELTDTIAWLLERHLCFSLNLYRSSNHSLHLKPLSYDVECVIKKIQQAFSLIAQRLPAWSLTSGFFDRIDIAHPHQYTCAANRNYLAIDQDGAVSHCQMTLDDKVTTVLSEDPLALIMKRSDGLQNCPVDRREDCYMCAWRYWCGGGCAIENHELLGCYEASSPHCRIYQAIIPSIIYLEGMRLLHWNC